MTERALLASGDSELRSRLRGLLNAAGYSVIETGALDEAQYLLGEFPVELLLLEHQLLGDPGALPRLAGAAGAPLVVLGWPDEPGARAALFRAGADDLVPVTCNPEELLARIFALRRRCCPPTSAAPAGAALDGRLRVDTHNMQVLADQQPVRLGPIEFRLLNLFLSQPERALTRSQIVERVWQSRGRVDERTVDAHVKRLRRALQASGHDRLIQTVRGVGYRFAARSPGET